MFLQALFSRYIISNHTVTIVYDDAYALSSIWQILALKNKINTNKKAAARSCGKKA
jgi:hypothetical protein